MTIQEVLEWIGGTGGQFFSIKFKKRTPPHAMRSMVCRLGVKKYLVENPTKPGLDFPGYNLICVWDKDVKDYRSIPVESITEILINGEWKSVEHPVEGVTRIDISEAIGI